MASTKARVLAGIQADGGYGTWGGKATSRQSDSSALGGHQNPGRHPQPPGDQAAVGEPTDPLRRVDARFGQTGEAAAQGHFDRLVGSPRLRPARRSRSRNRPARCPAGALAASPAPPPRRPPPRRSPQAADASARRSAGTIDALVNNAGAALVGAIEKTFDAAKGALDSLGEALAGELAALGIAVTALTPGVLDTEFAGRKRRDAAPIADCAEPPAEAFRDRIGDLQGHQPNDPARGTRAIVAPMRADDPPVRAPIGGDAVAVMRGKLTRVAAEIDAWEANARSAARDAPLAATA